MKVVKLIRFIFPHLGIVCIVVAMLLGSFYNWRGKAVLLQTDKTNVFITKEKEIKVMPYALTLRQFNVAFYDTGTPKKFEAFIDVEENNDTKSIALYVNKPCKMGFGQDLYLMNYDRTRPENPEWCTVEVVYEPFQGLFLTGIILLLISSILYTCTCRL